MEKKYLYLFILFLLFSEHVICQPDWYTFGGSIYRNSFYVEDIYPPLILFKNISIQGVISAIPVIFSDRIVLSYGNILNCLNKDGVSLWIYKTYSPIQDSPTIVNGTVFFTSSDGYVRALNFSNGKFLWQFYTHERLKCSPAFYKSLVIVNSPRHIFILNSCDGCLINIVSSPTAISTHLAIYRDIVVYGCWNGYIYAVNISKPKLVWKLGTGNLVKDVSIFDGKVFASSYDNNAYCIDISSGKVLWKSYLNSSLINTPVVGGGRAIFITESGKMYCLDVNSGKILWSKENIYVDCKPIICGNLLYYYTFDKLYVCDINNGEEKWNTDLENIYSICVYGDKIYIISGKNLLIYSSSKPGIINLILENIKVYGILIGILVVAIILLIIIVSRRRRYIPPPPPPP